MFHRHQNCSPFDSRQLQEIVLLSWTLVSASRPLGLKASIDHPSEALLQEQSFPKVVWSIMIDYYQESFHDWNVAPANDLCSTKPDHPESYWWWTWSWSADSSASLLSRTPTWRCSRYLIIFQFMNIDVNFSFYGHSLCILLRSGVCCYLCLTWSIGSLNLTAQLIDQSVVQITTYLLKLRNMLTESEHAQIRLVFHHKTFSLCSNCDHPLISLAMSWKCLMMFCG